MKKSPLWLVLVAACGSGTRAPTTAQVSQAVTACPGDASVPAPPAPSPPTTICKTTAYNTTMALACPAGQVVTAVEFASYGTPGGAWENSCTFIVGSCNAATSVAKVTDACLGKAACAVTANAATFGDPCPYSTKRLNVRVVCSGGTVPAPAPAPVPDAGVPPPPPPPPPPTGGTARPAYNTGHGFYVVGNKVYDANGVQFVMKGPNNNHFWIDDAAQIPAISSAGANAVRVIFGPTGAVTTTTGREAVVRQYVANRLVPVVGYWNATCDETAPKLDEAVSMWIGEKAWLQSQERYVILNISNEWGPNSTVWRDAYRAAVVRLRAAGIMNLLMVDAGGACGQLAQSVESWGQDIEAADPQHNVVFSIHQYGFWVDDSSGKAGTWDGRQPYALDGELTRLDATGLPYVIGEFSWTAFNQMTYTTPAALASYAKHGVGFLAWMQRNPNEPNVSMVTPTGALSPFGQLVVNAYAPVKRATVFP